MNQMNASSTKPYLIRAIHEWCVDNNFTPYVAVQVDAHTRVPPQHVRDGQIVLNIAPYATGGLSIGNDAITCQARFGGVAQSLYVPISQVLAIYSRENGQGMAFAPGAVSGSAMELGGVVAAEENAAESASPVELLRPIDSVVRSAESGPEPEPEPEPPHEPPAAPAGGKVSHLRRIK